jgi:hypothetical protein
MAMGITRLAAMPGAARFTPAVAALSCAAALAGCGSNGISGEIPALNAQALNSDLEQVRTAVANQDCTTAQSAANAFVDDVNALPAGREELKTQLRDAGHNLDTLVTQACAPSGATDENQTTTEPSTESSTESTETSPTTTSTTSSSTTDETETQPNGNGGEPPGQGGEPPGQGGEPPGGGQGGGTSDETGGTGG